MRNIPCLMLCQTGYIFLFNNLPNGFRKLDMGTAVGCIGFELLCFYLRKSTDRDEVTRDSNRAVCIRVYIHAIRLPGFWSLVRSTIGISASCSFVDVATYVADFYSWFKREFRSL